MFDARTAKLLAPGQHLTSPDHPGLRLEAFIDKRTWTYRYRSPIDNRLRQIKIGNWPAVSAHGAIAEWEKLKKLREAGSIQLMNESALGMRPARLRSRSAPKRL